MKDSMVSQTMFADDLMNVITGLGGSGDSIRGAFYSAPLMSHTQIENSFRTSWASRKVHTIPPMDMTRAWRAWNADPDDVGRIEAEEKRLGLKAKVKRALTWARLYGGSAIVLGTGDQRPELPLDSVKERGLKYIHVVTRHDLGVTEMNRDPGSEFYGQPVSYTVNSADRPLTLHPSRVVRFIGSELPDTLAAQEAGWGDPLLYSLWNAIINGDSAQGHFAALIAKAKVDTLTIPDFIKYVTTPEGEALLRKRVTAAQTFESIFNTKIINGAANKDAAGETWEQFQVNWSGIPEVMTSFMQMIAAAADIPMTRLMGMSPAGMNATGRSDMENYFQMISAGQEDMRAQLDQIDALLLPSAGVKPAGIYWTYNALWTPTDKERADAGKVRADAAVALVNAGLVPDAVMQEGIKSQLIESGDYPGIDAAYRDYEAGTLEPIIEEPEDKPDDPLIAVDPVTGAPTMNRESRLFQRAANDALTAALDGGRITREVYDASMAVIMDAGPRPLYVYRRLLNANDVIAWAKSQGFKTTLAAEDMHATVTYSRAPVDWFKMGESWGSADGGKATVNRGGPRDVERFDGGAVVLRFSSADFIWRHEQMIREGASWDFPEYYPHVTISYDAGDIDVSKIEPYRGELRFDVEIFEALNENWKAGVQES